MILLGPEKGGEDTWDTKNAVEGASTAVRKGLSVTKAAIFDGIWRVSCERAPHVVLCFPPSLSGAIC